MRGHARLGTPETPRNAPGPWDAASKGTLWLNISSMAEQICFRLCLKETKRLSDRDVGWNPQGSPVHQVAGGDGGHRNLQLAGKIWCTEDVVSSAVSTGGMCSHAGHVLNNETLAQVSLTSSENLPSKSG